MVNAVTQHRTGSKLAVMGDKLSISDLMRVEHKRVQYQQLYTAIHFKKKWCAINLVGGFQGNNKKKLWKVHTFFELKYMLFVLSCSNAQSTTYCPRHAR